jgi:hypothetical protein
MNEIKHQLKTVVEHRERYRNQREQNQVFQIALIGYTSNFVSPGPRVPIPPPKRDKLFPCPCNLGSK